MKLKNVLLLTAAVSSLMACASNNAPVSSANNPTTSTQVSTIVDNSVYFDFNSANVPSKYNKIITLNAGYLISHPNARIQIQGNSSEVGTVSYNQSLGMQRANSVQAALISAGAKAKQVSVISFGNTRPAYPTDSKGQQPKNQRTDIVYTSQPPAMYQLTGKIPTIDTSLMH